MSRISCEVLLIDSEVFNEENVRQKQGIHVTCNQMVTEMATLFSLHIIDSNPVIVSFGDSSD